MGIYAEGNYEAQEHSGRKSRTANQFRGVHDALHDYLQHVHAKATAGLFAATL
uniref:Uncharacterized protein n=1 Tax=Picea sitchensis TaxID=3332 RepID=A9NQ04_PICSI|nr:unknown [Picea sitchensis]